MLQPVPDHVRHFFPPRVAHGAHQFRQLFSRFRSVYEDLRNRPRPGGLYVADLPVLHRSARQEERPLDGGTLPLVGGHCVAEPHVLVFVQGHPHPLPAIETDRRFILAPSRLVTSQAAVLDTQDPALFREEQAVAHPEHSPARRRQALLLRAPRPLVVPAAAPGRTTDSRFFPGAGKDQALFRSAEPPLLPCRHHAVIASRRSSQTVKRPRSAYA